MSVGISMDAGHLLVTLGALGSSTSVSAVQAIDLAVAAAADVLHDAIRRNVSLKDHTLDDLARLDHPYAKRHPKIRIHLAKPYLVHSQSGKLLSALRAERVPHRMGWAYAVWLDPTIAPHAEHVVHGTNVMHPRNVLWDTATSPATEKAMMRAIVRTLGKQLRTKGFVRIAAGAGPSKLAVR